MEFLQENVLINTIGWIGSLCFAICAIPPAYLAWKLGKTPLDWGLLSLWFAGEVLTMTYILLTTQDIILLTNYTVNFLCLLVIIRYKIFSVDITLDIWDNKL